MMSPVDHGVVHLLGGSYRDYILHHSTHVALYARVSRKDDGFSVVMDVVITSLGLSFHGIRVPKTLQESRFCEAVSYSFTYNSLDLVAHAHLVVHRGKPCWRVAFDGVRQIASAARYIRRLFSEPLLDVDVC